jgi:pimeloyl-ACP methyl ester carboxylesterase
VSVLKSFAGGRLFGATWGSETRTVLALHGWARTHHDFDGVFGSPGQAAEGTGAIALDLYGFGATPPPPEPWGSDQYARHLLPLFEEHGTLADRVLLVGHSYGGRVAVRLANLVPDRIEAIVLSGVPLLDRPDRKTRPPLGYRTIRKLHTLGLIGAERMEAARNRYGSPDYRAAHGVMRDVLVKALAEDYRDDMAAIRCPVELVWGEKDTEVPLEVARRARDLFAEARLEVLPGVGHLVPTEAPRLFAASVQARRGASSAPRGHAGDRSSPPR